MASLTRWTWVWVNSGSWWWTGRPGVLWFMASQRVGHDWATELNWKLFVSPSHSLVFLLVSGGFVAMLHLSCWYWQLGCFFKSCACSLEICELYGSFKRTSFWFHWCSLLCVHFLFYGFRLLSVFFLSFNFVSLALLSPVWTPQIWTGWVHSDSDLFPPHNSRTRSSTGCLYRGRTWADNGTWAPTDFGAWGGPGTDSHGHQQPTARCFSYHLNI